MNGIKTDLHDVKKRLEAVTNRLTLIKVDSPLTDHINRYPLPSKSNVIAILNDIFEVIFPGYYSEKEITDLNIKGHISNKINCIYEKIVEEIKKSFMQEHVHDSSVCEVCSVSEQKAVVSSLKLLEYIETLQELVAKDVKAAFDGDPAARSFSEIIFSYPCILTITIHRIAHFLYKTGVPFIPRIMSEYAHSLTGIDIHPGATIGEYFFIDHGTGVVIGETCEIGNNVKLYQGVTLGALSFPKDDGGKVIKGLKRHPKIEDNVTIYAGATILGGETVIGKNSIIGGNVWITNSVAEDSRVIIDVSSSNVTFTKKKT